MVRVCCVATCKEFTKPDSSVSFFAFPYTNEELKEKWLNKGPGYKTLSRYSYICSKHFSPNDYTEYNTTSGRRVILKKNAVPSIFPNNRSEMTLLTCTENSDALQQLAAPTELEECERPAKKMCSVSIQTCSRLTEASDRELELQHKIKILQDRLRYKEKRIKSVQDLLTHLKKTAGNCSDALEDTLLKTFTEFDLELFKNQAHNNNIAKNRKI